MMRLKLTHAAGLIALTAIFASTNAQGYQFGGMGAAPAQSHPVRAAGNPKTAQERITLAQEALKQIGELQKKGELPKGSDAKLRWQERLVEAQIDAGQAKQAIVSDYLNFLQAAEAAAKSKYEKGEASALELSEIKFRKVDGQKLLLENAITPAGFGGMGGGVGFPPGGGGAMGGSSAPSKPAKPRIQHPADLERNKVIEEKLETPIEMHFAVETPLEDVIKYIKSNLAGAKGKPIPIYVDPIGLQEAEKTMTSPVILDIEDVPLRTTLRLMLNQISLDYRVQDGMVYITDKNSLNDSEEEGIVDAPAPSVTPSAAGSGFR